MNNKSNLEHIDARQFETVYYMKDQQYTNAGLLVKNTVNRRKESTFRLNGIFFYCKLSGGMINESICTSSQKEFAEKRDLACKGCTAR
jgi:hypothetical protein